MINMTVLINQLIQLFIIVCLGYLAYKLKIFDEHSNKSINAFILNITLPCMIVNSVLTMEERPSAKEIARLFGSSIAFYLVMPVIAFMIVKIMLKTLHIRKSRQGLCMFMLIFSNIGFMGFPILQAACGSQGDTAVFYAAVLNIFFNIAAFSYGIFVIGYGETSRACFNLKMLISPGIISSILAIVVFVLNIRLPQTAENLISTVGNLTPALAMLMVGSTLASIKLNEIFDEWKIYVFVLIKQCILPILMYPVFRYFLGDNLLFNVMFIEFLMPVANTVLLLSDEYNYDTKFVSKSIFISTALSLVTMPFTIYICNVIY